MDIYTMFGHYENVFLEVDKYIADESIAIELWNMEEGPIAHLTVCLCDDDLEDNEAYLDTNNCPWAMGFVTRNHLGEPTGKARASGFCIYPAVKFNMDEVMKHVYVEEGAMA